MTGLLRAGAVAVAAFAGIPAHAADDPRATAATQGGADVVVPGPERARLQATWWDDPADGGPGVVLVETEERDSAGAPSPWWPLLRHLRARGFDVLSLRVRPVERIPPTDVAGRIESPDRRRDVLAGVRWLVREGRCARERVVVVGAGFGACAAVEAALEAPREVAAVACVSIWPLGAMFESTGGAPLPEWPRRKPLLLLADAAYDHGTRRLRAHVPESVQIVYEPGETGRPTGLAIPRVLDAPLLETTIASFAAMHTRSATDDVLLDGEVGDETAPDGAWRRATQVAAGGAVEAWAYRVGRRLAFGGRVRGDARALFVGTAADVGDGSVARAVERAFVDLRRRTVAWADGTFAVRVVGTADGCTFEGERLVATRLGEPGTPRVERVAMAVEVRDEVPARGAADDAAWVARTVAVPSR